MTGNQREFPHRTTPTAIWYDMYQLYNRHQVKKVLLHTELKAFLMSNFKRMLKSAPLTKELAACTAALHPSLTPKPINVPTAGAQALPMDGIGRLGHDPPRGPSADWRVLTTADAAGTNGLTCLPKHGGTRDRRYLVTHPMTDHCESCLNSTITAERANHLRHRAPQNSYSLQNLKFLGEL
ncbi:hypothetical protein evm_008648 [Chilo suppressalis]|nr:hypothetical protein evm_008648 [Chilo suppressalis]